MNMMHSIIVPQECVTAEPEYRMGELLESAILRGGLLDARWWPAWVAGVQRTILINGSLLAVEMFEPKLEREGVHPHRRWFADPITKILIVQWWNDGLSLPGSVRPEQCYARRLGVEVGKARWPSRNLIETATSSWKLRLPGLLLAYARGSTPGASAPQETWERMLHGDLIVDLPCGVRTGPSEREIFAQRPTPKDIKPVLAILKGRASRYSRGKERAEEAKAAARSALDSLGPLATPCSEALRSWCLHVLERGEGKASAGYMPTTARRYLDALLWVFDGWPPTCPVIASSESLTKHVIAAMDSAPWEARQTLAKALLAFERYRNDRRPDDVTALPLDDYRTADRAHPDLILPDVYRRAYAQLTREGETELALALVLLFRAGLRWDEVFALRVGDVAIAGQRVELVVEANQERELKTPTSRRIIPLDVLLEADELAGLVERVAIRRAASHAGADAWLLGEPNTTSPSIPRSGKNAIDAVLRIAGNSPRLSHRHLRHSFASYLLATLLLPQEESEPAIPASLNPVVSIARRARVADRLLGEERLGAGALHAVSQAMGHTGPWMTLRYYLHLLDLSLGLHCSRAAVLAPLPGNWLDRKLALRGGARDKAIQRSGVRDLTMPVAGNVYRRPDAASMLVATSGIENKTADAKLATAGFERLSRELNRRLTATLLEIELPDRRSMIVKPDVPSDGERRRTATNPNEPKHRVLWRDLCAAVAGQAVADRTPSTSERWRDSAHCLLPQGMTLAEMCDASTPSAKIQRFVDARLCLNRVPTKAELAALRAVILSWRGGRTDIKLAKLKQANAFVRLLKTMGFAEHEIAVSCTSKHGDGVLSSQVHAFLRDRSVMPQLQAKGWSGSIVVQLRPDDLDEPIRAARACRFALTVLAIDMHQPR